LGSYYQARYARLLPHTPCQSSGIYAEANTTQRTIASAHAFMKGLRPDCEIKVHFLVESEGKENPLYLPALNGLADRQKLAAAIDGRMNGRLDWFTDAFGAALSEMQHVLSGCDGEKRDRERVDLRASQEQVRVPAGPGLVDVDGPVSLGADFAENFLLEYAEGMPMSSVGWGRVSRDDLNQLMEMNTRYHDFLLRTPYFAQVGGSEMAARIRDTLDSAAAKRAVERPFGTPQDRFVLLMGHDSNLTWLGGLLRLDWFVADQTFNATPPGSALVFELHHNRVSGRNGVQVFFISQTLNQIRNLSLLEGSEQPSVAPVFVPGCSGTAPAYSCALEDFDRVVTSAINKRYIAYRAK
jgi:4-phytase/acid phosphatase